MTRHATCAAEHPWYLDLRPDRGSNKPEADVLAALHSLDAIGAEVIAVHTDGLPSLADIGAGRAYVGWTILVPGSVERQTIAEIAAATSPGYRATVTPGHPLPPTTDDATLPMVHPPATAHPAPQIAGLR